MLPGPENKSDLEIHVNSCHKTVPAQHFVTCYCPIKFLEDLDRIF